MGAARWWYTVPLRLRSVLRPGRVEREMNEELEFHLDQLIADGVASGLSPEEARRAALRTMGGLDQHKEAIRDTRGVHALTDFLDDVRYGVRNLRRARGTTVFVAAALALGIGLSAASFSMMDALVFRPYPVPDPGRVVTLVSTSHDNAFELFSYREYVDLLGRARSYDGLTANTAVRGVGFSAEPGATPRVRTGMLVAGNYFRVLRVTPAAGRAFRDDEDRVPGRDAVVMLSHAFWKNEFAGDPAAVGRTVRLNGADFTVIGVLPESFTGMLVFARPDFYVPLAMARTFTAGAASDFFEDRGARTLQVRGRLRRDVPLEQARAELATIAAGFARDHAATNRDRGARVRTSLEMRTQGDDVNWKFSVIFSVLSLSVLLVACTNVAGLLLSRARSRTREIAVRLALGAGPFRVIRLLLTESLILAVLGGLAGVAVGYVIIALFGQFQIPTELPVRIPFRMDGRVLTACAALSVLSAILCGLAPALQSTRTDLIRGLKSGESDEPGRRRMWGRNVLVVAQVAMSLMLLTASFLMARSFRREALETSGFRTDHLLMARLDPRLARYDSLRTRQLYQRLVERARAIPGVRAVGLTQNPPLGLTPFEPLAFVPENYEMPPGRERLTTLMDTVDEGYFGAMGIALVEGRGFRASDSGDAPRVAVVNENFANRFWPGRSALGQRFRLGSRAGEAVEIVGVSRAIRVLDGPGGAAATFVYLPVTQRFVPRIVALLHTDGDPLQMVEPVRELVRSLDPNLPISELRTYEDLYRYSVIEGPGIAINMTTTMGVGALVLAIVGLYGLVAYNVSRRTHEIGIRMAVGASPRDILRMVVGKGLTLVLVGTAIELGLSAGVERLMNSMIFQTGSMDWLVYALVVPSMALVTLVAAWVPARRASRVQPTEALRYE